jgi:hypothetical protein
VEATRVENLLRHLIIIFLLIFFAVVLVFNFSIKSEQQFSFLARSFLKGKLYFTEYPGNWGDAVLYNGHYFWHLGPFPSVLLTPFVYLFGLLGRFFYQGYLQFFLTLGVFLICFKFGKRFGYSQEDSLFLAFAFCFASVYQMVAIMPWGWFFSQAITVFFLFLSINEYLGKKRLFLIGVYLAFVFATRFTAGFGILFFILDLLFARGFTLAKKVSSLVELSAPIIIALTFLATYNFFRFGDFFKTGYENANTVLFLKEEMFELNNYGLFKIRNFPTNFYYYFIKSLDPVLVEKKTIYERGSYINTYILKPPFIKVSFPGTSFFVVSPIFLYLLKTKLKRRIVKLSFVPILVILFLLLTYYWPGWRQVGPRYLLDLMPFAFILLLFSFKNFKLSIFAKVVILLSSLVDFYLFITVFA